MNVIETTKLTKYYGKSRGIENLDMEVHEGEIYGFIGPNGAGKSTTIRTLLNLIYPTSGSATVFGKDIMTSGPRSVRRSATCPRRSSTTTTCGRSTCSSTRRASTARTPRSP